MVGSTAYGLNRPDSDIDLLGIYVQPTLSLVGLHPKTDKMLTIVKHEPDITLHEIGKYCRLAIQCNPTILELMWLGQWTQANRWGQELIQMRNMFVSAKRARDAYFGYATQQFTRLLTTGKFESTYVARAEKHARHILRLLDQGFELYSTGSLTIKVADPERYFDFGRRAVAEPDVVKTAIAFSEARFDKATSPLPEKPGENIVNIWMTDLRAAHLY